MIDTLPATAPAPDAALAFPVTDLRPIREALRGLRFGSVEIVVQDGRVVLVQRLEKRRLS
jgi:hypothetical protein